MKNHNPTLIIIWGALFSSHFLHLALGEFGIIESDPMDLTIVAAICLVGISTFVLSLAIIPKTMKAQNPGQLPTIFIIQWALIESTAIFGLMTRFIGGEAYMQYGMAGLAMVGMMFTFPSQKVQEEMLRRGAE